MLEIFRFQFSRSRFLFRPLGKVGLEGLLLDWGVGNGGEFMVPVREVMESIVCENWLSPDL